MINKQTNIVENVVLLVQSSELVSDSIFVIETEVGNIGDTYNVVTGAFEPTIQQPPLEQIREEAIKRLSTKLTDAEMKGIIYEGNRFATDANSQVKYLGILLSSMLDSNYSVNFKTMDNTYVNLNATQVSALCMSVKSYIQSCYDHDAQLLSSLMSATTVEEINNVNLDAGWP